MFSRLGLRPRMAVSYVLVSAAAVLLVEGVLLIVMWPRVWAADRAVQAAQDRAVRAEQSLLQLTARSLAHNLAEGGFAANAGRKGLVQVLADADGRVVAADPADAYQRNAQLPALARSGGPRDGRTDDKRGVFYWAAEPSPTGIAYVELDIKAVPSEPKSGTDPGPSGDRLIGSLVVPGIGALVLLVPVGALFGLLSTGRLIRRVQRLADGTAAMSGGDLTVRVPVSGGDEVGRLERAFNAMAERLDTALAEQRAAAGAEARRAERGRIARELHDSISQDLFSVSLVAAGLRKALDPGSALQQQAESMEQALARTMREMRALLLELRPVQLEDAGLTVALEQLCRAYTTRLGIPVTADLAPGRLGPATEHAVLRVVQEAVGNAVRHGEPAAIAVRLTTAGDRVEVTVRDDGRGFAVGRAAGRYGLGLELMRERLREVDGTVAIDTAPGEGTTVTVTLPLELPDSVP
ncbi:HAMP domain-containing protein [Dactylosporangium vinaceum]|uniref:Oxygen sensor histidine kinase NreB n=1 Tax=Dactylosporangium vinaceum TaxID=53362 RepID=A0ABV5M1F0_9ACTN|nr:ATP-binding protein [Dactylosporangium vinaceum]UAB99582.1 HAMP domain-containing protein [Dactylosporangium vinaceum]